MTAGSLAWGAVAEALNIPLTLNISAIGLAAAGLLFHFVKLPKGESDLIASNHWPEPLVAALVDNDRGPVLILIEYKVDKTERPDFLKALAKLSNERRRDGRMAGASPRTLPIRRGSSNGSWSNPGPSTFASTGASLRPTPMSSKKSAAFTKVQKRRS